MYEKVVQVATRAVVAAIAVGMIVAHVLASDIRLDGRDDGWRAQEHYVQNPLAPDVMVAVRDDGSRTHDSSDNRFVFHLVALLLVAGAIPAARRATPRRLAIWVAVTWPAVILYHGFIDPKRFDRPFDVVMYATLLFTLAASVVLAFASVAARARPTETAPRRAHRVRSLMRVMLAIGIAVAILGFFPGTAVYDDASNCLGYALAGFGSHGGAHDCTSSYTKLREVRAAGGPLLAVALVVLLAPALAVHADPGKRRGFLVWLGWVLAACVLPIAAFALTFHLDLFSHTVTLWAGQAVATGLLILGVLFIFVLPTILIATREDKIPTARAKT